MRKVKKYLKIWWMMSVNSFSVVLGQKYALTMFLIGKIIRFTFYFLFIFYLLKGTGSLAGYSINQVMFFFLIFNLVDVMTQFLFRQVYSFRPMVVKGDFDLVLVKPINALFRVLMGGADLIDLITILPLVILIIIYIVRLQPNLLGVVLFLILLVNSFIIATAFHIMILAFGIITLEVDHTVMIYRDITNLGKVPIDVYKAPLKQFLTYIIPVGIIVTIPGKALMGLMAPLGVVISLIVGIFFLFLSLKFWKFALTKYTSASS